MPNRLFIAPDGAQWVVSLSALAGSGSTSPGTDLSQCYDRGHLVFDSVTGNARRSLWVELPVDLERADQDQLAAFFELAGSAVS